MTPAQRKLFRKQAIERAELSYEHAVDWVDFYAQFADDSADDQSRLDFWVDERNKRLAMLNTMKTQNEE